MSKNVSIEEGDRSRNFGPTSKIKTELQGGGECYWVPEDERFTAYVFASKNREYTAENISAYGIGEIDVNVIYAGVDPNGNPWYVYIDPNTGMPVIEYPEAKVTDFDIRFPSGIAAVNIGDNEYILEEVDTGKQIRVDKVTGEIITIDPKYEDTEGSYPINVDPITGKPYVKDPETGEPFVDGDGNPINPVTGNPISIEDIQTGDNPAGVTITINPETGFPVVEDPFTGEPIAEFDDESMSEMGIDPTSDIDISMNDPGDIEMGDPGDISIVGDIDGIPSVVDLDLDDMEWESEECPESIYVLSRPAGIVYNDGDTIDFTGFAVAALDKDGMDWPDSSYPTPIPNGKIIMSPTTASTEGATPLPSSREYHDPITGADLNFAAISDGQVGFFSNDYNKPEEGMYGSEIRFDKNFPCKSVLATKIDSDAYLFVASGSYYLAETILNEDGGRFGGIWGMGDVGEGIVYGYLLYSRDLPVPWSYLNGMSAADAAEAILNAKPKKEEYLQKIYAQWTDPCFKMHETSFEITVFPKEDHGGSHHSGKF